MHSFHQSRSRIAFEVLCALTVSASCAAAWMQLGATAFLPAAVATGLYGLWHLTDMRRPKAASVPVVASDHQADEPARVETVEPAPAAVAPAKSKKRSRKKPPAVVAPDAPVEAVEAAEPLNEEAAPKAVEIAKPDRTPAFPDRAEIEEELHPPIAPLFEAKPFVQQQRMTFGRKAG